MRNMLSGMCLFLKKFATSTPSPNSMAKYVMAIRASLMIIIGRGFFYSLGRFPPLREAITSVMRLPKASKILMQVVIVGIMYRPTELVKKLYEISRDIGPDKSTEFRIYDSILRICLEDGIDLPLSPDEISGLEKYLISNFHQKGDKGKDMAERWKMLCDAVSSTGDRACSGVFYGIKLPGANPEDIANHIETICKKREAKPSGETLRQWKDYVMRYDRPEAYRLLLLALDGLNMQTYFRQGEKDIIKSCLPEEDHAILERVALSRPENSADARIVSGDLCRA